MFRRTAVLTLALSAMLVGSSYAQQCLHGPGETAAETARRRQALTAARTINNIQANQPGAISRLYLRHVELAGSPYARTRIPESRNETVRSLSLTPESEVLPNWRLVLDVTQDGYWFMIKDQTDPCGFAYVSNQDGVILAAEPIR